MAGFQQPGPSPKSFLVWLLVLAPADNYAQHNYTTFKQFMVLVILHNPVHHAPILAM
jgi:hypothetical protein